MILTTMRPVAGRKRKAGMMIGAVAALGITAFAPVSAAQPGEWSSYLNGPAHSSYESHERSITPANASSVAASWTVGPGFLSSPTVYQGTVYVGGVDGTFYAIGLATGQVVWQDAIGKTRATTCGSRGFASSATVAPDPVTSQPTVYVASPTGYMYAFDAATGNVNWRSVIDIPSSTQNDYFDWSSPTVAHGKIFVGVASQCDKPLVRAGAQAFDQETGQRLATFYSVPAGSVGGSVWSSPAVDPSGQVYLTTGNGPATDQSLGSSESIIKLTSSLKPISKWQVTNPAGPDSDFGGSPTLFSATLPGQTTPTAMVGACNKNGYYYALNRANLAAGPVWSLRLGNPPKTGSPDICIAAAAFDGKHLFLVGPATTISGTAALGSVQEVDPTNGAVIWRAPVGGGSDGSPSLDGAGVLAVPTFDITAGTPASAVFLFSAATGHALATISGGGSPVFAQPVFAEGMLLVATTTSMTAYHIPSTGTAGSVTR